MITLFSYLIWGGSPEIFSLPLPIVDIVLTLRWYGLLFALGFLISQQILYIIYKKEGKPEKDVDTLTLYMVVATIIGARLGHVLFYEPARYFAHPMDILKIWEGGLASHGGAFAILFALWLYARKGLKGQSYLQVVDRIVILVALTGALIRLGNFYNSEIIGKPTESKSGIVFSRYIKEVLQNDPYIADVHFVKVDSASNELGHVPVKILIDYKQNPSYTYQQIDQHLNNNVYNFLLYNSYARDHIYINNVQHNTLIQGDDGRFYAIAKGWAVARHPAQLYEAISCVLLFIALFLIWNKHRENLPPGRLLGIFLIVCFGLRIVYELFKENQVEFENDMSMNMGQILSIPLVLAGIFILWNSYKKQRPTAT